MDGRNQTPVDRSSWLLRSFDSFEEAEAFDREQSLAMTSEERLRSYERLRQLDYNYGEGKPPQKS